MRKLKLFIAIMLLKNMFVCYAFEAVVSYDSKYIFKGYNLLKNSGIYSYNINFAVFNEWQIDIWHAKAKNDNYVETDFSLSHALPLLKKECIFTYRSYVYHDSTSDKEWEMLFPLGNINKLNFELVYSYLLNNGAFLSLKTSLSKKFNKRTSFNLLILTAFDFGYNTENYDGFNHFEMKTALNYSISPYLVVNFHIGKIFAGKDMLIHKGHDSLWYGFSMNYLF